MGCRPSRNSLGRIADSTSDYNRHYIKELDKARRKQKKSALNGRRRAPTYNAFSSTTKCYERDEGASKITVRLSTDGSMLEIEQYDIDFISNNDLTQDSKIFNGGLEMKPFCEGSVPKDILLSKRFSYGRCGSAPLLAAASLEPPSVNIIKPISSSALRCIDGGQNSHASVMKNDSNSKANSNVNVEDSAHPVLVVNVHNADILNHEEKVVFNKENDNLKEIPVIQNYDISFKDSKPTEKNKFLSGTLNQCVEERSDKGLAIGDNNDNCFDTQSSTRGALTKCLCTGIGKTVCSLNDGNNQIRSSESMYCVLMDGSNFKLVSTDKTESENKEMPSECDTYLQPNNIHTGDKHVGEINKEGKRHRPIENKNACDRFLSYCFLCEKDKSKNEEAYYACKCNTLITPNTRDFGTDSNANVCCCRRFSSHQFQKSISKSSTNRDKRYSSFSADDKMSAAYQTRSNSSNPRDKYKYHPINANNLVIANIDCQENEQHFKGVSGQSFFSPNEPNVLCSDHLQCHRVSVNPNHACPSKECLDIICWENLRNYNGIRHTCCDKCETVSMETNDVSELTPRNDGQIRCYHSTAIIEETQFSNKGNHRLYCNADYVENTEDEVYHDACGCQQCTYVTATSQCQEYADSLSDDDISTDNQISPKNNENRKNALCNAGCCEYDSIVSGDIWQYKQIDMNADNYDIGNDESGDSDSSDDYRDDDYVDAMETTYV